MWTVLGTVAAVGLVGVLIPPHTLRQGLTGSAPLALRLSSLLGLVLAFLPLLVAALQLGRLHVSARQATQQIGPHHAGRGRSSCCGYLLRALRLLCTSEAKVSGSRAAISASILRFRSMPAIFMPCMKVL
jgi:hypothetical protein